MANSFILTDGKKVKSFYFSVYHHLPQLVLIVCIIFAVYVICRSLLRFWDWRQILRQKYVFIEITPPLSASKTPLQSTEWIKRLYSIGMTRTPQENLQRLQFSLSLELPSTQREGIRYYIRTPERDVEFVKQSIASHLNKARIRIVEDYLPANLNYKSAYVLDFKQLAAYYLPLNTQDSFLAHDPVAHLTNAMTGLKENEHVVLQLILKPAEINDAKIVQQRLQRSEDMLARAKRQKGALLYKLTFGLMFKLLSEVVTFIGDVAFSSNTSSPHYAQNYRVSGDAAAPRPITASERELNEKIGRKVTDKMFRAEVRALVIADDKQQATQKVKAMKAAVSAYDTEHQQLRPQWSFPSFILNRYRLFKFTHRLPSLLRHHSNKLAASEIADIYHFPAPGTYTENLVQSQTNSLPATLSQKRGEDVDVVIGRNIHQEQQTEIGLTAKTRMMHTYLIGSTGTGKTTLLESVIYQDMLNGKGLAVLDPHGDMFKKLLAIVPEHRKNDVVVFNPADRAYPFGINILNPGISFDSEEDGHSWIASSVITIFSKLADETFWGPRMEHILQSATLTALKLPNPNIYTLQRLLTDKRFQRETVKKLDDRVLKDFWLKEMLPLGESQLATTVAPLTHRLGHFITDTMARNILLQQESTLRMSEIIDEGKILLVNLSKGDVGEDKSYFFGTILTSLIWMAAYQRTRVPEKYRRDFYLYIDEFQNFAAPSFADITSEGRKFHIALTVSHQNVAQIEDQNLLKIMAGNAHTFISLRASPNDEAFILPFMEPAVEKGNIVNLAPHHFYMKTTTDESELAFSGVTVPLDCTESQELADSVIAASRDKYATPRKDVEDYLDTLFSDKEPPKKPTPDDTDPGKNEP